MLLAVGCSFTCKRYEGDVPWPEHLSKELNKPLINKGMEGVSNKYIFRITMSELQKNPEIDTVVLGLTGWDRFEFVKKRYMKEDSINNTTGKTLKFMNVATHHQLPDNFDGRYLAEVGKNIEELKIDDLAGYSYIEHYNIPYFIDETVSYILALHDVCDRRNIKLIIMQLVPEFNGYFRYNYIGKRFSNQFLKPYVEKKSNIKYINKNILCSTTYDFNGMFSYVPRRLSPNKLHTVYKDDIKNGFRKNVNVLGYHENIMVTTKTKHHPDLFDPHPDKKGQRLIFEKALDHYNKIENLDEYYKRPHNER